MAKRWQVNDSPGRCIECGKPLRSLGAASGVCDSCYPKVAHDIEAERILQELSPLGLDKC